MLKARLQESYRLADGTILDPHWDEWFVYGNQNLIDHEEVTRGILNIGEWIDLEDPNPKPWNKRMFLYWRDPDNGSCSKIFWLNSISGDFFEDSDGNQYLASECESPTLIRRIAETDIDVVQSILDQIHVVQSDVDDTWGITSQNGLVGTACTEELANGFVQVVIDQETAKIREELLKYELAAIVAQTAREIFNIEEDTEDIGVRIGEPYPTSLVWIWCELGHIPDQFGHGLYDGWAKFEKLVNNSFSGKKVFFEPANAGATCVYYV